MYGATYGGLVTILRDPAFVPFLAAAPQAGRILRPLCRMLGIDAEPDIPAELNLPKPPPFRPSPPLPPPYLGIIDPTPDWSHHFPDLRPPSHLYGIHDPVSRYHGRR